MEELFYRFPHIASMILNNLDDQSLIECIEANRELNNLLCNDRMFWTRVLAKYKSNFIQFTDSWRKSLRQVPVVRIKELAIAAQNFFKNESRLEDQWSPLDIVANKGSLELYKYISRKCGSISQVRDDGITAIHMAAIAGNLEIVTFIIDNHQNQNQCSADGLTPLHCAVIKGHFETCRFIINLLQNKNPRDNEGFTPLHGAVELGHIKICKLLLEDLVDKNPANNNGWTPLHTASAFNQLEPIKLIMPHVQNKNPEDIDGFTPLQVAIELGHLEIAKLFLEHPDVEILGDDSYTVLHSAARYGDLALCKLLMEFFLIDNSKVKNYADRNGWTPLHFAAINGHVAIYELLSEYIADDHRSNNVWTFGHFAAKNGISSRLRQETGRDLKIVSSKTNDGTTPLKLMAFNFSQREEFIRCTYDTRVFTGYAGSWKAILGNPRTRPLVGQKSHLMLFFDTVRKIFGSHNCHRTALNLVVPYIPIVIYEFVLMLQ